MRQPLPNVREKKVLTDEEKAVIISYAVQFKENYMTVYLQMFYSHGHA